MKCLNKWSTRAMLGLTTMFVSMQAWGLGSTEQISDTGGAGDANIEAFGSLANTLQAWLSGDLGLLISMVGLLVAVIMVIARASMMPVLFVLGLVIILGWGPVLFAGILQAEMTAPMIAAAGGA